MRRQVRTKLKEIVTETANLFNAEYGAISVASNGSAPTTLAYGTAGFPAWLTEEDFARYLREGTATGKPMLFVTPEDPSRSALPGRLSASLRAYGIKTAAAAPILHHDRSYGTLAIFFANRKDFSEEELGKLSNLARAAAPSILSDSQMPQPQQPLAVNAGLEWTVTQSPAMLELFEIVRKAAATDANVLIVGESGVGKELIARSIHNLSRRNHQSFVAVDCVALPTHLIESELFGFEKGAFTGSVARKHGLLEIAHGGTFFFDEISELDLALQAKLLRVLQERQVRRIGGEELINVNIRVVSATNRDPEVAVRDKVLRHDLYFRLNVIPIRVPPLRERKEDIPRLAAYFLNKFVAANDLEIKELASEAIEALQAYDWPGNVRELQNVVERVVSLCSHPTIVADDLPAFIRQSQMPQMTMITTMVPASRSWREAQEAFKLTYFKSLFDQMNGDIYKTAQHAQVSWRTVYRMLNSEKLS